MSFLGWSLRGGRVPKIFNHARLKLALLCHVAGRQALFVRPIRISLLPSSGLDGQCEKRSTQVGQMRFEVL